MSEPSYEELKARVAELEKKGASRRTGSLEFRVGDPWSKVGWWSDSAFAAPDDRVR